MRDLWVGLCLGLLLLGIQDDLRPMEHCGSVPKLAYARFADPSVVVIPTTAAKPRNRGYARAQAMGNTEVLDVPPDGPDGHCLFSCATAARDIENLSPAVQSWGRPGAAPGSPAPSQDGGSHRRFLRLRIWVDFPESGMAGLA